MGADIASRTQWLKGRLYNLLFGAEKAITAVDTSTDRLTVTGHDLPSNTAVQVFAANGGALSGGLAEQTVYYVEVIDGNTIRLSASSGPGAAVDLTAGFAGDVYVQAIPGWISSLLVADATYGYGKLKDLVVWLKGTQTVQGAKTFDDITATNYLKLASRSVSRFSVCDLWVHNASMTPYQNLVPIEPNKTVRGRLRLPHGQTLTAITIWIDPVGSSIPGVLPSLQIQKWNVSAKTAETLGSQTFDAPADNASYAAVHSFTIAGLNELIDNTTYFYTADFASEDVANIQIVDIRATCTVASDKDWA